MPKKSFHRCPKFGTESNYCSNQMSLRCLQVPKAGSTTYVMTIYAALARSFHNFTFCLIFCRKIGGLSTILLFVDFFAERLATR